MNTLCNHDDYVMLCTVGWDSAIKVRRCHNCDAMTACPDGQEPEPLPAWEVRSDPHEETRRQDEMWSARS